MLMWWWTYTCHIKGTCCDDHSSFRVSIVSGERFGDIPLGFRWSEAKLLHGPGLEAWVEALTVALNDEEELLITGQFFRDEGSPAGWSNLGLARAEAVAEILSQYMPLSKLHTASEITELTGDFKEGVFTGFQITKFSHRTIIEEYDDRIFIRFPSGAPDQRHVSEILPFIEHLWDRVARGGAAIRVSGSTAILEKYGDALMEMLSVAGVPAESIALETIADAPIISGVPHYGIFENDRIVLSVIE